MNMPRMDCTFVSSISIYYLQTFFPVLTVITGLVLGGILVVVADVWNKSTAKPKVRQQNMLRFLL